MKRALLALVLVLLSSAFAGTGVAAKPKAAPAVPDEVVIQFREGATEAQQETARKRAKAKQKKKLRAAATGEGALELATLPKGADPQAVADLLAGDPAVLFAEPNFIYTRPVISAVSGDRGYANGSLWGMYSNDSPTAVGPPGTTNATTRPPVTTAPVFRRSRRLTGLIAAPSRPRDGSRRGCAGRCRSGRGCRPWRRRCRRRSGRACLRAAPRRT